MSDRLSLPIRVVVVGAGMVAARFVEELLDRDTAEVFAVSLLGDERHAPYNRVLLSDLLAGRTSEAALNLPGLQRPDRREIDLRLSTTVASVDRERRIVTTDDGSTLPYEILVLATGARPRIPAVPGLPKEGANPRILPGGVLALRSLDDARTLIARSGLARRAIVVGGGVLGVEAAVALAGRDVPTTLIHPLSALMERQLDVAASDILAARLAACSVTTELESGTAQIRTRSGNVTAVQLADGRVLPAELVVFSCGTIPAAELAAKAGLPVERGIVVGEDLASVGDPDVFAIGDCAQPPSGSMGLIAQGWDQARRLAVALVERAGQRTLPRSQVSADSGTDVVRVKGPGIDLVTMGQSASCVHHPDDRVLRLADPAGKRLVEIVIREERIVGATCVGAGPVAADLLAAYTRNMPLPADPAQLLLRPVGVVAALSASPTNMPSSMTVCRCNGVTKGQIVSCFSRGARTVQEVAAGTRATTGCGGCTEVVTGLVDWLRSSDPDTPPASQSPGAGGEGEFSSPKHEPNEVETPAA